MINKIHKKEAKFTNEIFEIYKKDGCHYLRVDFNYENDFGIFKCYVDNLKFDLKIKELICESDGNSRSAIVKLEKRDGDFLEETTFRTPTNYMYTPFKFELVKEKVHEVTMEEIEKKFGHKIKIVSKKFGE